MVHLDKKGNTFLVVVSILAAATGILMSIVATTDGIKYIHGKCLFFLLSISFILFLYVAEKTTDVIDQDNDELLVYLYIPYNISVILLIISVYFIVSYTFFPHFLNFLHAFVAWCHTLSGWSFIKFILITIPFGLILCPSISDTCFLMCSSNSMFNCYVNDKSKYPKSIWWVCLLQRIRKRKLN